MYKIIAARRYLTKGLPPQDLISYTRGNSHCRNIKAQGFFALDSKHRTSLYETPGLLAYQEDIDSTKIEIIIKWKGGKTFIGGMHTSIKLANKSKPHARIWIRRSWLP